MSAASDPKSISFPTALGELLAHVQKADGISLDEIVERLNQDAGNGTNARCTYSLRSLQGWIRDPPERNARYNRRAHLCAWFSKNVSDPRYSDHIKALAPPTKNSASLRTTQQSALLSSHMLETASTDSSTPLEKTLSKEWDSHFYPCLIDSSYLQSAGRAFLAAALSVTDIQNFLRLLGEIIVRREVCVILATKGPVFPHSKPVVDSLNEGAGRKVIKIIAGETINYRSIVERVLPNIRSHFKTWISRISEAKSLPDITSRGGVDSDLHDALVSKTSVKHRELGDAGAQFLAHHILTHPTLCKDVRDHIWSKNPKWTKDDTVHLCSAVRAECYFALADIYGYSYQPSAARYVMVERAGPRHIVADILKAPSISDKLDPKLITNAKFLNALILLGKSDPPKVLKIAAEIGAELEPLRERLTGPDNIPRGDGWRMAELGERAARLDKIKRAFALVDGQHEQGFTFNEAAVDPDMQLIFPWVVPVWVAYTTGDDAAEGAPTNRFVTNCGLKWNP